MRRWLAVLLLCLPAGCDGCGKDGSGSSSTGVNAPLPPVPAPADLTAEMHLPRPQELLRELRAAAGGPALFLPRSLGAAVVNAVGFPITAAEVVDEQVPLVAAMSGTGASRKLAVAVHLLDREKLVTIVGGGKDAFFDFKRDGEKVWFEPRSSARAPEVPGTVALVDNYLVFGTDREAVEKLGPYLARTLGPKAKRDGPDVVVDLVAPVVPPGASLKALAAKLPLPRELGAMVDMPALVDELVARLGDTKGGHIAVDVTNERIELTARLEPKAALPAQPVTPRENLLSVPDDVVVALTWADQAKTREASAAHRAEQLKTLLGKPTEEPSDEPSDPAPAMASVARGMGDRHTLALRCTGVGLTGFARGEVKDADALGGGLSELTELRQHPSVEAHLEKQKLGLSFETRRLEHVPFDVTRLRLTPEKAPVPGERGEVDLLFGVAPDHYLVAAGMQTVETVQRLEKPDEDRELSKQPLLAAAVARLPEKVWAGLVVDAQNLHGCLQGQPGGQALPVAAAVGPDTGAVVLRLEAARSLVKVMLDLATR